MPDGFLGTRGSLMIDVVFVAMFLVLPVLYWSIYTARVGRHYPFHKRLQLTLGIVLLVAVSAFELEMRLFGWQHRAELSPYWRAGRWNDVVDGSLAVHLACAIPTFFIWVAVIVRAVRTFPRPAAPNTHSGSHRMWGWMAAIGMTLTATTGWVFYWLAFVASPI
ncbi:MAG: DUF420 domain-containing protein [Planctomycetota bacterium]|nr:DUF420 domain-containing protein [Planctomycetota bacterium]MDA1177886.1 DUF420 domain-containing protein [Planctomycetota bacterium]